MAIMHEGKTDGEASHPLLSQHMTKLPLVWRQPL